MKSFADFLFEQATQPVTHAGIKGKSVSFKQSDGTQWNTCVVSQITPDSTADTYNLTMTDGNTRKVALTPDQVKAVNAGDEVVATHDGMEFWFGKSPASAVNEAYDQKLKGMDAEISKALGGSKSRKSGRTEFEYSVGAKTVNVNYGGEDEPYAIVSIGGKEKDFSKGKTLAADIAKYIGVKPV